MAEPALQRGAAARRLAHDRGVVADAGVEAEEAAVDLAETDRADVGGVDAVGEQVSGARPGRWAARACGRRRWSMPPGSTPSAVSVPAMPGRHLVQRAVAAEADDDVDAAAGGVVGEAGGVPAPVGLDELDVVALRQRAVHDHGVACRHRRGEGVDDQQDPQGA